LKPIYNVGDTVNFIGSQSIDQDGDALTYLWNFGDGRTSTEVNPKIKYSLRGSYTVTLTVTDKLQQSSTNTVTVVVGTRPIAKMESPIGGTEFKVGDIIRLKGSAFDTALNRSIVDPTRFFWEVRQHHETHFHPFLDLRSGNDFTISPAPMPEDLYAASNSYLQIIMTVYDSDGISKTLSRYLYPKKVQIAFKSEPSGLEILLEGISFTTPITVITWQNQRFTMNANDQGMNKFVSWSTGTNRESSYLVPTNNLTRTITAYFRQSLRPTKAPVVMTSQPISAPTVANDPSVAPIFVPTERPTEFVSDRNWFQLFWKKIKSIFSDLWIFNTIF
jgi:PKD repeat protein